MIPLEKAFLNLVRLGIGHPIGTYSEEIDWNSIEDFAIKHGLLGVVLDGIERLPETKKPKQELLLEWIGEVLQGYEYRYEQYRKTHAEMAGFYNSHGYKMMVLKGYACAINWPKPSHRPCGDIDIWQFGKQKEADEAVVREKGITIDNSHHHHTIFNWGEFTVENHYDFIEVHRLKSNKELEKIFKELAKDESNWVEISGEKVFLPLPNLHALFLIKHMVSHFSGANITIRQVLDWAFFVEKHNKEIDWSWLKGLLRQFHMNDFVNCLNAICVEDLGFEAGIFHGVQFNPQLKDRILADILFPKYATEEPTYLIPRLLFKYKRWQGNGWKQKLCYNESRWSSFWTGIWAKILKPASL